MDCVRCLYSLTLLAALAPLAGCGGDDGSDSFEIHVRIDGPQSYRAILASPGAQVSRVSCPDRPPDGALRCGPDGVVARRAGELTVKASGFAFQSVSLSDADVTVTLEPLGAFEVTEDYRTGFDAEGGLDALLELSVPTDSELGPAHSLKFYLDHLDDQPQAYFQDTRQHPLHYDFVRTVLGVPLSVTEFEQQTYRGPDRGAMGGTLVYYPTLGLAGEEGASELSSPITLNFFPSDDLSPEQALLVHQLIEERLLFAPLDGERDRLVYVPAGATQEQQLAEAHEAFLARDALWAERSELYAGLELQLLNPGLAYGMLRRLTPEQLEREVVSFTDVVLLTRLPNELPIVGGSITEELQTPLAHVNVAARARGTPNIALLEASTDPRVAPFIGQLVRFEVTGATFTLSETTLDQAQAYWNSLAREPLVPESDLGLQGLPSFDELDFSDAPRVGVKAANLAELWQLLGANAWHGFAVPFSAYDAYMSSNLVTVALCDAARDDCEIDEQRPPALCDGAQERCVAAASEQESFYAYADRLLADAQFASDSALREACLDSLTYLIGHGVVAPEFGGALDARVAELFGDAKVRLRSSTNAEDLPGFSGAGLYQSLSAYANGNDRASARIRKVWASVWSWRAFEERSFWGIAHQAVRMGVAVNPASDDEVANGVLITQNLADPNVLGMYVNVQAGEASVTNPDAGALPEVFSIVAAPGGGVQVARQRLSSLWPDSPLLSDEEVSELYFAAARVQEHFAPLYGVDPRVLVLDLEFKFCGPERALIIKQARPYSDQTSQ
jgi:pyruvate,water dikinase